MCLVSKSSFITFYVHLMSAHVYVISYKSVSSCREVVIVFCIHCSLVDSFLVSMFCYVFWNISSQACFH